MREAALPCALLAASLGMALSYAEPRASRLAAAVMAAIALTVALVPLAGINDDVAFTGCWVGILMAAASVHLPKGPPPWLSFFLAANGGLWAGLVSHVQGGAGAMVMGLPLLLLLIPGQMLIARGWGIAIKVACSWLIAIALLEAGLNLVPTPGYMPDHMD